MIAVVDYGVNNSNSVIRMIQKVGGAAFKTKNIHEIKNAQKLIIPGVGSFDEGMKNLSQLGMIDLLKEMIEKQEIPVLGICLGMQLLCHSSEEGTACGLGLVPANVKKLKSELEGTFKVPHMGWNTVKVIRKNRLFDQDISERRFYFVHSYYVEPESEDICSAKANYGLDFCAAFEHKNIYGVQFHPEKSHRFGMSLIRNFVDLK